MTQITSDIINPLTNIQEELRSLLLQVIQQKELDTFYQKTFVYEGKIDEVTYFGPQEGEYVKGYLLKRFDVIFIDSWTESVDVKKEVFVMENGEMVVFNHIEKYFEGSDTYFATLYRELSTDQTLTAKEFVSLVDTIKEELDKDNRETLKL